MQQRRKASCSCHDTWILTDAASILVARDVADVVVAIFDAPMPPNDVSPLAGTQPSGRGDIGGDLAAAVPHAGCGAAQPGLSGDTDYGLDEGTPLGLGQGIACGKDFDGPMFLSGAALVLRRCGVGGGAPGGDAGDGVRQLCLVVLELDEEMVAGGQGGCEGFFGRAWHRE
jgi:hypothetical protein